MIQSTRLNQPRLDLFFHEVAFVESGLSQNRPKSAITYFFLVNRYDNVEGWKTRFAVLGVRAGLGNKKEALTLKDTDDLPSWNRAMHVGV